MSSIIPNPEVLPRASGYGLDVRSILERSDSAKIDVVAARSPVLEDSPDFISVIPTPVSTYKETLEKTRPNFYSLPKRRSAAPRRRALLSRRRFAKGPPSPSISRSSSPSDFLPKRTSPTTSTPPVSSTRTTTSRLMMKKSESTRGSATWMTMTTTPTTAQTMMMKMATVAGPRATLTTSLPSRLPRRTASSSSAFSARTS